MNINQQSTQLSSKELELEILSAMIEYPECYYQINSILNRKMFSDDKASELYSLIESMHSDSIQIDVTTVHAESKKRKIDIPIEYLCSSGNTFIFANSITQRASYLKAEYLRNEQIRIYRDSVADIISGEDANSVLSRSINKLNELEDGSVERGTLRTFREFAESAIKDAENRVTNFRNNVLNGIPTFSQQLDKVSGGWQNGELIIIAARPAMGKTAIALKTLENSALSNCYPGMWALEMKGERLIDRMILEKTGVPDWKYKQGSLTNMELLSIENASSYLYNLVAHIDDNSSQKVSQIKSKARILKKKSQLGLIIIDYLQLAESDLNTNSRNEEVASMTRALKKMAKELDVPVIALSQLNRGVESRADKRPQLSDLRDSGAIEQDADMVMFVHRPEYYNQECKVGEQVIDNGIEIIIAKYREGQTCSIFLQHDGTVKNIKDYHINPF